jgi:hypothetical protein
MIYDQLDAELKFFVLDGDYTHLDGVYVNSYSEKDTKAHRRKRDALQGELTKLVYEEDLGTFKHEVHLKFPTPNVLNGAAVIVAGFLP